MRVQTAFRLDKDLLKAAKKKAKSQKRSLNNYIEVLLYQDLGNLPNNEDEKTSYETHNVINITEVKGFDKWIKSLK